MNLKDQIVAKLVKLRTSFVYVWLAITLPILWILLHRLHWLHIDNEDMTYLNVTLSILAEVQGVVLLIYTTKIAAKQENADLKRVELHKKLADIQKVVKELDEDIEQVEEDLQ